MNDNIKKVNGKKSAKLNVAAPTFDQYSKNWLPMINHTEHIILGKNGHLTRKNWKDILLKLESAGYLASGMQIGYKLSELKYPTEVNAMCRYIGLGYSTLEGDYKNVKMAGSTVPCYDRDHDFYMSIDEFNELFK